MPRTLKAGDRISEYILEEKVGQGGFGEVWRARHNVWGDRQVAIKIPLHDGFIRRLQKEGKIQHDLQGDGVVKTIGLDPDNDPPYLILEWVDGGSLRDLLDAEGRLPLGRALDITLSVLRILEGAHARGIAHRDIKPENILIEKSGKVLLADFGLSRVIEEAASEVLISGGLLTKEGEGVAGTIAYMSPEQKDPRRDVDHRTDIYSLGLVLFELLTGSLPEGGEVPSDLDPEIPREVDDVFKRCYARLEKRYASAAEGLAELGRVRMLVADRERAREGGPPGKPGEVPSAAEFALLNEKEGASFLRIDLGEFRRRVEAHDIPVTHSAGRQGFRLVDLARVRRKIQDEILRQDQTFRPPYPVQFAGFWVRTAAFSIDMFCLGLLVPITSFVWPLPLAIYGVLMHGVWGKTIGKAILGIKIVPAAGGPMNPGIAFVRMLGKVFCLGTFTIGFIFAAFHPQKRALHDLIADTWVIHDRE